MLDPISEIRLRIVEKLVDVSSKNRIENPDEITRVAKVLEKYVLDKRRPKMEDG